MHHASPLQRDTEKYSLRGGGSLALKTGDIQDLSTLPGGILVNVLPGSQENRRLETNSESEAAKQVYQAKEVQDGLPVSGPQGTYSRSLGHIDRFERRLPPCPDLQGSSAMASLLHSRPSLCLQIAPLWTVHSSKGLHKSSEDGRRLSSTSGSPDPSIPGRLAHNFDISGVSATSDRVGPEDSLQVGVCSERKEITSPTYSNSCLPGSQVRSCPGESFPVSGQSVQFDCVRETIPPCTFSSGGGVATPFGSNGQHGGLGALVQVPYEAYSVAPAISLSAEDPPSGQGSPSIRHSSPGVEMVEFRRQFISRNDISCPSPPVSPDHGRISDGVGGSFGVPHSERPMDQRPEVITHKYVGASGGVSLFTEIEHTDKFDRQNNTDQVGQYHSGFVYKQTGGDKIPVSVSANETIDSVVHRPGDSAISCSHPGGAKLSGRQLITGDIDQPNRVVITTGGSTEYLQRYESVPQCRSVRYLSEQTDSNFLCKESRPPGTGDRCAVHILGQNDSICVPPDFSDLQGDRENSEGGMRDYSNCTILAQKRMVSESVVIADRQANHATGCTRPAKDCGKTQGSFSQRESLEIDCMEIVERQFQEAGFSQKSANLAAKGRRKSTLRVYTSRVRKFFKWCDDNSVDPYHASIPEIADFLRSLFESGMETATIKGYRSAILAIHRGFPDGSKLKDDPRRSLHFLIEGMHNTRPPTRKVMPEWDLAVVLGKLNKPPFEPLQAADIRDLTIKTAFLIAIASGRRCSEIHALASGDRIVFSSRGVTMHVRPDFLAKNESSDFSMSPLFIPYLDPSKSLERKERLSCPVRALRWYLARTETARSTCESTQLFITSRKPFRPAAKTTIAGWIVAAIVKADAIIKKGDQNKQPTAHSTRAVASSFAFNHGLSVSEITNTVSWRSETTFVTTYLRDVGPCCEKAKFARSVLGASSHKH